MSNKLPSSMHADGKAPTSAAKAVAPSVEDMAEV